MAKHISSAHGVIVAGDLGADVTVGYDGNTVTVSLSESLVDRTGGEILRALRLDEPSDSMERKEYLMFLNMLHAYLTVTPLRDQVRSPER